MSSPEHRAAPHDTSSAKSTSRRIGYAIAVVVNLVFIWLINVWPGWQALPFLTAATQQVVTPVTLACGVAALTNLANLIFDRRWLRAVGEFLSSAFALSATLQIWGVFPFDFAGTSMPWEIIVRVILVFAIAGCVISLIVQVVLLARLAARAGANRR